MSMNAEDGVDGGGHSLVPLLPWLLLAAALSVTMMVLGAGRGDRLLPALSAGLFASLVVGTGLGINAPLWSRATAALKGPSLVRSALRCNVWLAALIYAWGASAMFGMYSLSDLVWRHAFQYAGGASVFAAGIALYGFSLGRSGGCRHSAHRADGAAWARRGRRPHLPLRRRKAFNAEIGLGRQRGLPLGRHRRRGALHHVGADAVARHSFLNAARRFSRNAAMPSFWSCVANSAWKVRRS